MYRRQFIQSRVPAGFLRPRVTIEQIFDIPHLAASTQANTSRWLTFSCHVERQHGINDRNLFGVNTVQTKIDDLPNESANPEPSLWRRALRYASGILSFVWTGYFLNTALHRWARWQSMKEYFGPVYPRELESTVHAIKAALDWRIPFIVACLPSLVFLLWLTVRQFRARNRNIPE